ncbi:hypothetical protein BW247_10060 [Acidihalobacter ferrooxydans]|uniref:Glycoside-hydrolase family GH114 TIM-barrel domain-containing protein n=2 Tax=Acidihalobacter ferrooxydans TaxID=1765967 RepID=A0A1P8UI06_9GAMM|nr:hypothetical protein BW247_10060 [Acidihalobacter ferrooxydans]
MNVLQNFDWVVVQAPDKRKATALERPHSTLFAYVSLGEAEAGTRTAQALPSHCRLGKNSTWNSIIVDQSNPACRAFYLDRVIAPLLARGYHNFFFDTLDSYRLVLAGTDNQAKRRAYRAGLIDLIKAIHQRDPTGKFILNRGFELLDALHGQGVVGVAAESLYRGWDQKTKRYVAVPRADTDYLLQQFAKVRKHGLVPIAIDYLPPQQRTQAEALARKIAAHGIAPYVTDGALNIVGVSSVTPQPRRILMLYEGPHAPMNNNLNWYAAMPLNHLGYATRQIDVSTQNLPTGPLTGQVAGIVTWFDNASFPRSAATWRWLHEQIAAGVPVAVLGSFGAGGDSTTLQALALSQGAQPPAGLHPTRITQRAKDFFGFENPPLPSAPDFIPWQISKGKPLLTVSEAGQTEVAAAITPWGGYALSPYVLRNLPQGDLKSGEIQAAWILNPFRFFRAALRLPEVPVYDYTTASGRRLLFGLIDGDGFASGSWIGRFRDQPAAKVILDQVLKRFPLPITASVIASEFAYDGLYPKAEVNRLRPIARAMFRLPWVEMGSHTYSHPFDWPALERDPNLSAGLHIKKGAHTQGAYVTGDSPSLQYGYNLPVPGYRFSPEMEVTGSVKIIDRLLAPPGKRVRVIQWSGDTNPDAEVLGIAYRDGLANINDTNSTIDRAHPSLTNVAPLGVWKGPYFQVYSPIANEDQYTHGWQPPYCGYNKAIQTMQMTGAPRRLTAMQIYYHFYSGARACALKDLTEVYQWAQKQSSTPVFASTYSHIAVAFEHAGLARTAEGYLARGYGLDQELRIPASLGYPDLARSRNIAGFDVANGQRYIHLGPGNQALLVLSHKRPHAPYLVSANGLIENLQRGPGRLQLKLRGFVPLSLTLGNAQGCRIRLNGKPLSAPKAVAGRVSLHLKAHKAAIAVACGQ